MRSLKNKTLILFTCITAYMVNLTAFATVKELTLSTYPPGIVPGRFILNWLMYLAVPIIIVVVIVLIISSNNKKKQQMLQQQLQQLNSNDPTNTQNH